MRKLHTLLFLALVIASGVIVTLAPQPVAALTATQKKACQEKWSGNYLASSQKVKNLLASDCYSGNGGNCTATNHPVPNELGDEEIRTTVICPLKPAETPEDSTPVAQASGCKDANGNKISSIIPCGGSGNPIINMLLALVNFLAIGVGIAVVGGIIWGAITYIRSNGNSSIAQQGITIIINAVVGLLLFIFMYAIINFLVPGGLFT